MEKESRILMLSVAFPAAIAGLALPASLAAQQPSRPNIIYILADDLGYGDLSCYGQVHFQTPNLDRLADDGIRFTQHYAGCPVSAPSRSVLMSGLHMGHTSIRANRSPVVAPEGDEGQLPLEDGIVTIAEMLKSQGYATGAFGKWGLGFIGTEGDPNKQGFDEFFGFNCQVQAHRYYAEYLWHNGTKVPLPGNDRLHQVTYTADAIHAEALAFIEENKDVPFFLYCPTTLPHAEMLVPDDEIFQEMKSVFREEKPFTGRPGHSGENYGPDMVVREYAHQDHPHAAFAAMVKRIDKYVGEIVAKVRELGLEENTVIIFASDNGPHKEGGADPVFFNSTGGFRGIKRDLYEGGIRTPMIVCWPGHIAPGRVSDHISAFWDVKPTLAELSGASVKEECDGISFLPELLGKKQRQHRWLYWEFHDKVSRQAVRMGRWKGVRPAFTDDPDAPVELYDLKEDPAETSDVASEHPCLVRKMARIMKKEHVKNDRFPFKYELD